MEYVFKRASCFQLITIKCKCKSIKSVLMKVISANKHQTLPKDIPDALSASDFAFQMGFYITFGVTIIFLSFFFYLKWP